MSNNGKYVSRAGEKLEYALEKFEIDVNNKICVDLGCSTGGFVDCLLKKGAIKVYAIDTAYGELDWNLRNDDRVIVKERTNALHLEIPESIDLVTIDVGWTRQELILPKAIKLLKPDGIIISLIKPQYEAPKHLIKNGKVKTENVGNIVDNLIEKLKLLDIEITHKVKSPIVGNKGKNEEYLILVRSS